MKNNYILKTLGAGSKFEYGGISWVLLQKTKTAALCLAEKILFNKAFDEDGNNNWAKASLRKYLNGEFLEQLAAANAEKAAFLPFTVDITADDGLKDYSKVTDRISLITCELYRKHRYIIPNADDWWTVTAYSTASNGYSRHVRNVNTSGALDNYYAPYGRSGVRPLCNLNSSIVVSASEERDYTPEKEPKMETAEQQPKPATEKQDSTRTLHKKAIRRAYEVLETALDDSLQQRGIGLDVIVTSLATLQNLTKFELTAEEKAELHSIHNDAIKKSYKCIQLTFDLFLEKKNENYPNDAIEALAFLPVLVE